MIYMVVMMMMAMLGVTAMVVDVGRTFIQYHQLVASTDAAALAGAQVMASAGGTASQTTAAAISYSSTTGDNNTFKDLSTVTTNVSLVCLTSTIAAGTPATAREVITPSASSRQRPCQLTLPMRSAPPA